MGKKRQKKWSNRGPQPFRPSPEKPLKMQLMQEQGEVVVQRSTTIVTFERRGRENSIKVVQTTLSGHVHGGFCLNKKRPIRGADGAGVQVTS